MGGRAGETPRTAAEVEALIDRLAELVADGMSVTEAGARLGITQGYASVLWSRLKKRMGGPGR